ncbi:MAG: hypothetical protein HKN67_04650 [Saprospiraceae bacterium]|nr:FMN-binding protein [Bacteroidia bacterium]NNF21208.1 hypothetical protein [Saprospiraceae bacterium]NNK89508.1 hypothetical protein [Saprospiraceae bacterium]
MKIVEKQFNIKEVALKKEDCNFGELFRVMDKTDHTGFILLSEVAACNLGGCHQYSEIKKTYASEFFDLLVITDLEMNIKHLKILNYFSEFGYQVTSKKYLKKFTGKNVCDFLDDTDEIDIVSGATISSYALEGKLAQLCNY